MEDNKKEFTEENDSIDIEITEAEDVPTEEPAPDSPDESADKIASLEADVAKAREDYIRLYAEYDNYRKRTAREKTDAYSNASAKYIETLLPVIDSFERSLECECSDENFKNGMNMIFNQLREFLSQMNVTEIDSLGKEFNPNFHNAVQQLDGTDYASGYVCAVYQKGYVMGDKLIRPAMVAVAV